jgi:3-phytase
MAVMSVQRWALWLAVGIVGVGTVSDGQQPVVLTPVVTTSPLHNYEGAPATPDADDPAIWVNRGNPPQSLLIGTAKDAGLLVYDLSGNLLQALLPPNAPQVSAADPDTPAGENTMPDNPCTDSETGEAFGRFNNVDILYNVHLGHKSSADVAVVSDRGCDRVRFYKIDPGVAGGPLVDITSGDVPRVFPERYEQPSPLQPSGAVEGWQANPVDDQNTVYGLTVAQHDSRAVFVTQRERGLVRQLQISAVGDGTLTYEIERTFLFRTSFRLRDENREHYQWTPCREAALEEPQAEGIVFDSVNRRLYVAFETIGLYQIPLRRQTPELVEIMVDQLIEPVRSFGHSYRAIPDDDEFECEYDPETIEPGDVVSAGSLVNGGSFVEADLEGLTIVSTAPGQMLLLASSQGDSSFHFYQVRRRRAEHLGLFFVNGVGDTDGVHYVAAPLGPGYPLGVLAIQNGEAPEPADTGDINGYEFDGSTQFMLLNFADALAALDR